MPTYSGGCLCGAVRFEVEGPFDDAGVCHCHRCQVRSGQPGGSLSARVPIERFRLARGELAAWVPEQGNPKHFCRECGTHVVAGSFESGPLAVRAGTLEDPGVVETRWHVWTSSAPPSVPLPDDGLPRFERGFSG